MSATGDFPLAMPQYGISIALAPHARAIWSVDREASITTVAPGNVLIHSHLDFVWHHREKTSDLTIISCRFHYSLSKTIEAIISSKKKAWVFPRLKTLNYFIAI